MVHKNIIYNRDCLEGLKELPSKSVDLVFYDPPYNVGKKYDNYSDDLSKEDYTSWMNDIIEESERVSNKGVLIYTAGKLTSFFSALLPESHLIIIVKRAAGICSNNYMQQYHSLISSVRPIIKTKDVWDDVRLPGEGYFFKESRYDHPGLTGLELTNKIIKTFSEPGDLICDPFMGTGTTAISAITNKRDFIGFEQSKKYIGIADMRIKDLLSQKELEI